MSKPEFTEDTNNSSKERDSRKTGSKRNKNGGKGGRRSDKGFKYGDTLPTLGKCNSPQINSPEDYFFDKNLAQQATDISFTEYAGTTVERRGALGAGIQDQRNPYLATYYLSPAVGYAPLDSTFPTAVNLAAQSLYTDLSANNAKTTNYAPQDLTMLVFALAELCAIASHMQRGFGLYKYYSVRNRAVPKYVMEGLGYDYDDLMQNFANYRVEYNAMMVNASKIPIPANIKLIEQSTKRYSGLYMDMQSDMAQFYAFVPYWTWVLDEESNPQGTQLTTKNVIINPGNKKTMRHYLDVFKEMLDALLNSSTLNTIYADIIRCSEKEGLRLMPFNTIGDEFEIVPKYDPEIRLWVNNLVITGTPMSTPHDTATHTKLNNVLPVVNTNRVFYAPQFTLRTQELAMDQILNFDFDTPKSGDIIEATRLKVAVGSYIYDEHKGKLYSDTMTLGHLYCVACSIFYPIVEAPYVAHSTIDQDSYLTTDEYLFNWIGMYSKFDWSPIIPVYKPSTSTPDKSEYVDSLVDLNHWTYVPFKWLKALNDIIFMRLLELR